MRKRKTKESLSVGALLSLYYHILYFHEFQYDIFVLGLNV